MRWRLRDRREPEPGPAARLSVPGDPAARGARGEIAEATRSPLGRLECAAARFNASEAGHSVAGLVRTLGDPAVSVGAAAGSADQVRITVAWEFSWYQWGVDLGDELRPVFELAKGSEIAEIEAAARQWNASTVEGGRIVIVAPRRRPGAKDAIRR